MFTHNIEQLTQDLNASKQKLLTFLKRNFKENIHYITEKNIIKKGPNEERRGGHNKIDILLTSEAFELLKNSYNFRNRNITEMGNVKLVNVVMCIEKQTIDFIEKCYNNIFTTKRQHIIGKYRVDLYFPTTCLIVECDEFNHIDRDINYEKEREEYLMFLGNNIIRYNPNEKDFDLSNVLNKINCVLFKK